MNKLIGSAPSIDQLTKLISKFYGGSNITLVARGDDAWYVHNSKGKIDGVGVKLKKGRYRFEEMDERQRPYKGNPEDEEIDEADEEDIFLSPSGPLGSRTSVSAGGKFLGEFSGDDEAEEAARKWADKNKFYPNAWQVSDHGNYHLISDFWKKKEKNPNRAEVDEAPLSGGGRVVLWKNVETSYHPGSKSSKIRGKVSYSVVIYAANGEAQEDGSEFGIKSLAEAKSKFKAARKLKHTAKEFVFTSGIRKVTVSAENLDEAKEKLEEIEPSAWDDPNWNWKIHAREKNPKDAEPSRELLLDESRGIYIPKKFAENFDTEEWHIDEELVAELKEGPDGENYWEAWEAVLRDAWMIEDGKKWNLEQDGDLFAVHYEVQ